MQTFKLIKVLNAKKYFVKNICLKSFDQKFVLNKSNTSLAAPGALAHRLQRRTACNTTEASLHSPNKKTEVTSL